MSTDNTCSTLLEFRRELRLRKHNQHTQATAQGEHYLDQRTFIDIYIKPFLK